MNTSNGDKGLTSIRAANKRIMNDKMGELNEFSVRCQNCNNEFVVNERAKLHPQREVYFCSRSCANDRGPRTTEAKKNISDKLKGRRLINGVMTIIPPIADKTCPGCSIIFTPKLQKQRYCNRKCSIDNRHNHLDKHSFARYRQLCAFRFGISDFPQEFDFSLIASYGWYQAANRGNNLGGISRDHIVSVKYGHEHGIDPRVIAHPANCRLMIHSENVSKGPKSAMTIDELLVKIELWNAKYGRPDCSTK